MTIKKGFEMQVPGEPARVPIPAADREWVFDRAKWKCEACGCQLLPAGPQQGHVDHIVPVTKGGPNNRSNYQALCRTCNLEKGDKTIDYRPDGRQTDFRTKSPLHQRQDEARKRKEMEKARAKRARWLPWIIMLMLFVALSAVVGLEWFILTAPASFFGGIYLSEWLS